MSMMMTMMLPIDEIADVFHDVTPIPQDDDGPVCTIEYPTSFRIAHEYMRACFKDGEKSERSLKLSATCLKLNPANYTVWHYRRACMDALGYFDSLSVAKARIQEDLGLASQLGGNNPKNYQVWYHRRALLEAFHTLAMQPNSSSTTATETLESDSIEFLESELDYLDGVLDHDSKNYHAWSHRQWLVRTINSQNVWDEDVEYTATLIEEDPRNNSAWNERWFAVHKCLKQPPLSLDKCRAEADFAIFQGAALDPYNESPFRYLIGLLHEQQQQPQSDTTSTTVTTPKMLAAEFYTKVQSLEKVLVDANRDPDACTNWNSTRIDLLESMGDTASLTQAIALAQGLANQYDTIRQKYWEVRIRQLEQKLTSAR